MRKCGRPPQKVHAQFCRACRIYNSDPRTPLKANLRRPNVAICALLASCVCVKLGAVYVINSSYGLCPGVGPSFSRMLSFCQHGRLDDMIWLLTVSPNMLQIVPGQKDCQGAIQQLQKSLHIYPQSVALRYVWFVRYHRSAW